MTTLDEQFEKWWKTWAPLDCGKDHAKAAAKSSGLTNLVAFPSTASNKRSRGI
jgi:hypothetical protein